MSKTSNQGVGRATVPAKFVVNCLLLCSIVAFSIGRITRFYLVPDLEKITIEYLSLQDGKDGGLLPTPKAQAGKIVPQTIYTTKNFDTRLSALSASQWLQPADEDEGTISPNASPTNNVPDPMNGKLSFDENGEAEYDKDDEEHLPAGQHLLVDIDGLDASFLNSEARLATAMISMVDNSGLTLLSYHCHGLYPEGVSCAGVLLESHVAFHTWPTEGVITLDLFTCGSTSLLDSMPLIEDLFVIPRDQEEKPNVMWAYKRRGFNEQSSMTGERDTFAYPLGVHGMMYKQELASMKTSAGKIARVYEMQELNYPHPTRQVYLDGVLKSNSIGQAAAHESAVHPPMISHDAPKRVVIFGAGLGASTREVLKHKTVEEVTIVGADRNMVEFSKKYLPEWSDCSYASKGGSATNCFDDSRVNFVYDESPSEWIASFTGAPYDVALVDLFDMEEEFATEIMLNRQHTVDQLFTTLSETGVISFNLAGSSKVTESMTKSGVTKTRQMLRNGLAQELKSIGFVDAFEYDEYRSGFSETRSYVVAFKDDKTSKNWKATQADIKRKLKNRIVRNESTGEVTLEFFDAATMTTYSTFSKATDTIEILSMNNSNQQGANASSPNAEGNEECPNPTLEVSEQDIESSESLSSREAARQS